MTRRGALRASLRFAGLLLLSLGALGTGQAQIGRVAAEHQIKAAYLYKFLAFVEWPAGAFEGPQSPFVIGVVGDEALADELALVVAKRQVVGRSAVIRKLRAGEPLSGVHVLFVGAAAGSRTAALLAAAREAAVLTVTESNDGFPPGSDINFVVVDNKVRFDVSLQDTERRGIKISSRLLGVARQVLGASS